MAISIRRPILGALIAVALVAAGCSTPEANPTTTTTARSSTTTIGATTTTSPPGTASTTTTTVDPADPCEAMERGLLVDLDGTDPLERAVVLESNGSTSLVICDGATTIAMTPVPPGSVEIGAVDLDGAAPLEIAIATEVAGADGTTTEVRAVRATIRGLEVTPVLAARRVDTAFDGETPFEAVGFACADVDDDGANELLDLLFRSAETGDFAGGEGMMNLSIGFVVADGNAFVTAGFDSYELPAETAFERFDDRHRCEPGAPARVDFEPAVDGWAILDAGDTFAGPGDSLMTGIAVDTATGRHVAVGSESPSMLLGEFFEQRPAIWWSDDRRAWTRADLGDAVGEFRDVAALPGGGFVAVGGRPGTPMAWLSANGITWEPFDAPVGDDGALGQFSPIISAVAVSPDAVVGVGVETYVPTTQALGEDLDAAVWRSTDGRTWERVADASLGTPGFQVNDGAEFNGELSDVVFVSGIGFIAVGSAGPPDPTIDYPTQTPAVWVSADGTAWQRHDIDADARLRGIAETAAGAVVFGVTDLHGSPTSDAIALTSVDGATWVLVEGPFSAVEEPDGIQTMNGGVFVTGLGTVVVGSDEAESETRGAAAVWVAGDTWARLPVSPRVFGQVEETPTFTMTDAAWNDGALTVVGFSGRQIDLPGGIGTACCVYEPAVWVWRPQP